MQNSTSALCGACCTPLPANGEFITCNSCMGEYHFTPCAGIKETTYAAMSKSRRAEWRCTSCKMRARSASSNNIGEIQLAQKQLRSEATEDDYENGNQNKRYKQDDTSEMKCDIKKMLTIMSELKEENQTMKQNIMTMNETINKLITQITELTESNKDKDKKIKKLENKINYLEQQTLQNNIEISNVPMQDNEDVVSVVKNIVQSFDIQLTDTEITDAYRTRKKQNIVIKLANHFKKREIMKKTKEKRAKSAGPKIYINDQLTAMNKKLLWLAKTAAKQNSWKFVWVRGGQIYAKKDENSALTIINQEEDINNIV